MAERKPLILIGGIIRQLPAGDTVAGATGPTGPQGPEGPAGPTGPQGPAGSGLPLVRTPTNLTPANGATAVAVRPMLTGNTFGSVYGVPQAASRWQVATISDFASPVYDSGDIGGSFDPYSAYVSLAARFDSTFADLTGKTITPFGNAAISSAQSKFGGGSAYFDGSGDYLTLVGVNAFHFSTLDFTWECWVRRSTLVNGDFDVIWGPSNGPRGIGVTLRNAGQVGVWVSSTGASWDVRRGDTNWGTAVIPLNTWVHLAVVRSGSNWYGFVDGVVDQTFTHAGAVSAYDANIHICRWDGGYTQHFNGYIDDLRVTKGVARYTSAFTPPVASILPLASSGITNTLPSNLAANTLHYWRCMYRDSDGVDSAWSTATSFTTGYPPD